MVCKSGNCVSAGTGTKACNPPDCDDGNPCTVDKCDSATGLCSNTGDASLKGKACTVNGKAGTCNDSGKCIENPIPNSGGSQSGGGCFIEVKAAYDGKTFNTGETAQVDPSAPLSVDGTFSLSQKGCSIESGEYGFWGTKTFSGGKAAGDNLNQDQLNNMSNGEKVTVSGISISDLSGYENSTLYFGLKGSVKKAGADSFEQANSMWVGFEVGQGGENVTPPSGTPGPGNGTEKPQAGPIAGCDPCLSITGCLACLDKGLVNSSFK